MKLIYLVFTLAITITSANSFSIANVNQITIDNKPRAIILLDPFADYLSRNFERICKERGYEIIGIVSPYMCGYLASRDGNKVPDRFHAPRPGNETTWAEEFSGTEICAVLSESDSGLAVAERIQVALNLPGNGECPQLRNKYLMNEACKEAGLETVKQFLAKDWDSA